MKKAIAIAMLAISLALCATIAISPKAFAGDKWTGCYGGLIVGYSASKIDTTADVAGLGTALGVDGLGAASATFGGTAGCDYRVAGPFVLGVWGEYLSHDQTVTISSALLPGTVATAGLDTQWAIGGRVGAVLNDNVLLYGVAGYTQAAFDAIDVPPAGVSFKLKDASGYIVGGGAEFALPMKGFSLDLRYTYSHFDKESVEVIPSLVSLGMQPDVHTARLGLLYRFGAGDIANLPNVVK